MSAAAKKVDAYELENAKVMKAAFEEALAALNDGKKINEERIKLYERTVQNVKTANNSVERKGNMSPTRKNKERNSRYERIRNTLRRDRNYATHINRHGKVTKPIPVSFVNILYRKIIVERVDEGKKFKIQPGADIRVKRDSRPPIEWRESDPAEVKHSRISTKILDGSIGKWKEGKLVKEGASVIAKMEEGTFTIKGAFKTYGAAAIAAHPDLKFCDEDYWKEHEIFKDI